MELGLAQLAARRDVKPPVCWSARSPRSSRQTGCGRARRRPGPGLIGRFEEAATVLELALPPLRPRSEVELLVEVEFIANASLIADRLPLALERMQHYREADAPAGIGRELAR